MGNNILQSADRPGKDMERSSKKTQVRAGDQENRPGKDMKEGLGAVKIIRKIRFR